MLNRCLLPTDDRFANYGGRGISVCARWQGDTGFAYFLADMGERPAGKTLDRFPNRDGNYEPTNCRWATYKEQNLNQERNRWVTHGGETLILGDWAKRLGMNVVSLHCRIYRDGWDPARAVSTPKGTRLTREQKRTPP